MASDVETLERRCRRQAQEIHALKDTVEVYRKGASALALKNRRLSADLARTHIPDGVRRWDFKMTPDLGAPVVAHDLVAGCLSGGVSAELLGRTQEVAAGLISDQVGRSGHALLMRVIRSPTTVRVEVAVAYRGGSVAASDAAASGTQSWAELAIADN